MSSLLLKALATSFFPSTSNIMSTSRIVFQSLRRGNAGVSSATLWRGTPVLARCLHASATLQDDNGADTMKRIKDQLKNSMRSKDSFASTVYRSLLSEHQYAVKAQSGGSDDAGNNGALMTSIMQKAIAKRQESSRQFRAASPPREDLAEKEDREVELIKTFLPEQISTDELEGIVQRAIDEVKAAGGEGKKMLGDVMKHVSGQVDKGRAPGAMVSEAVRRLLSK